MKIRRSKKIIVKRNMFTNDRELSIEFTVKRYHYDIVKSKMYMVLPLDQARQLAANISVCAAQEFILIPNESKE